MSEQQVHATPRCSTIAAGCLVGRCCDREPGQLSSLPATVRLPGVTWSRRWWKAYGTSDSCWSFCVFTHLVFLSLCRVKSSTFYITEMLPELVVCHCCQETCLSKHLVTHYKVPGDMFCLQICLASFKGQDFCSQPGLGVFSSTTNTLILCILSKWWGLGLVHRLWLWLP